jgi:hypothetical protein
MTMRINPLAAFRLPNGSQSVPGRPVDVPDAFGADVVGSGRAVDMDRVLQPGREFNAVVSSSGALTAAGATVLSSADMSAARALASAVMPPELEPTNWFPDQLFTGRNGWLYGRSSSNALDFVRVDPSTRIRTVTANPFGVSSPQQIRTVIATSRPGIIFAVIGESSQTAASIASRMPAADTPFN